MLDLLKINNVTVPNPTTFDQSYEDEYNEFKTDAGTEILEEVRTGILSVNVGYVGLPENTLETVKGAITPISSCVFYDPTTQATMTKQVRISGVTMTKICYKGDVSVWSLTFACREIPS